MTHTMETITRLLDFIRGNPKKVIVVFTNGVIEIMSKTDAISLIMRDGIQYVPLTEDVLPVYGVKHEVVMELPKAMQIIASKGQKTMREGAFRPPSPSRRAVFYRDLYTCQYCGRKVHERKEMLDDTATIDHMIALSKGGPRRKWTNLLTTCSECNNRKGDRSVSECGLKPLSEPQEVWLRVR